MVVLWTVMLIRKKPVPPEIFRERSMAGLLVFRCISAYGFTLALAFGALVSVATYISALTCIATAAAGIIFLKEKDSLLKKTIAGAIAVAGAKLIFFAMR